jgi:5-methylthioadenosine/S-adenosylhomocysteine deaminase
VNNMKLLLINAEVLTINEENEVLKNSCVGISEGKIDYLGEYSKELSEKYNRVVDLKGKLIMPGLVNGHGHAAMTMFRNYADDLKLMDWLFNKIFPLEDKLNDEIVYWGTKLAILEMIKSGTTTYTDMYFFMNSTAKAVSESGIRACLSRGLVGDTDNVEVSDKFKEALDLYKEYNNSSNGRIKVNLGPHSVFTCSLPYLKGVVSKSEELNIPIQIHLSETRDEVDNCYKKYGVSPVKLLEDIGMLSSSTIAAHCVVLDDEDINILSKHKVNVVHNPGSNLKLASGISPVCKMRSKGINVCLGTDGAASNNNLDMFEEIRTATYIQKVFTNDPTALAVDEVLKMATVNGAAALGFDKLGAVKLGMKADLVILNTEKPYYYPKYNTKAAIVYSGNSSDVEMVIIDGKLIMENNNILTMDEEKILYETQRLSKILIAGM